MSTESPARDTPLSATKRELLERRLRRRVPTGPVIPRRPEGTVPPLSYAQERVWFMEQFAPGTAAYTIPVARRLRGALDVDALERALADLVARHETLRSRYLVDEDGQPRLDIAATLPSVLTRVEAADRAEAERLVNAGAAASFDLAEGPLIRALLIRLTDTDHVLLLTVHHSVSDGWSSEIMVREVLAGYAAHAAGSAPRLPELAVSYGDFAIWQRERLTGETLLRETAYWRTELAGVEPLELPTRGPRPARQTFAGAGHAFEVDRELLDRLAALARERGATLYMVLLAAFQLMLARHSGQREFAVGSPVAGRPHPEVENLVGMFVNVVALRARTGGDPTFAELLDRTRETCLEAYAHQELPFAQLVTELNVARDVSRSPVFQAVLAVQNYATANAPDAGSGLTAEAFGLEAGGTRFDLELFLMEWPDGLYGAFNYNTDLFDETTIARLGRHLGRLLAVLADRPDVPVSTLDGLDPDERDLVLIRWNDTAAPVPERSTLVDLIADRIARTPDATAVVLDEHTLTYRELDAAADRVAHRLRAEGVRPGDLVAVGAERSPELVAALLGVLRTGAGYTPLDPEYPAERLAFMLADSGARVLLSHRRLPMPADCAATVIALDDLADWPDPAPGTDARADVAAPTPDDVAYMIYTSGSTGRPKGVPNTHRGIVNRIAWMQDTYRLGPDDAVLQKTPASFDVSVWEFFWPLTAGARLVLARPGGHKDAGYLRDVIAEQGVTVTHFVPAMLTVFLAEEGVERCTTLRRVVCSGEELAPDNARAFRERLPNCALANLYGPTEAAVDVTAWECAGPLATVPIGAPIHNTRVYVLDEAMRPAPLGTPGELYLGGVQVALGYHRRPGLTGERFVPDPFGAPGARLYRTGDLARWRPDGTLDFLGRIDGQVKLRGLRIELGEIEAALRARPEVDEAAVVVREDTPGDKRITAYVVPTAPGRAVGAAGKAERPGSGSTVEVAGLDPSTGATNSDSGTGGADHDPNTVVTDPDPDRGTEDFDADDIRAALKRTLPDYMVPAAFVALPALPLTPSGKLDRKALPAPAARRSKGAAAAPPTTPAELLFARIWCDVLTLPEVGVDDDFFDLGGHSLLATQVVARARKQLPEIGGRAVSVMDVFTHKTIREIAALSTLSEAERGPARLLYRLSKPVPVARRTLSLVCVPYGGGSAVVYQPLADALPDTHDLWSVAIPGHDVGVTQERLPFEELARRIVAEVQERVEGPIALYGHCGVGSALIVAVARQLEAAGRELDAVYIGAQFPFARPRGRVLSTLSKVAALEPLLGDRVYANWLTSMGADMADLDGDQMKFIIGNMRRDSVAAEEYFTEALSDNRPRLRAPIVSVMGDRDPAADFYQERFREWRTIADRVALVMLDEAGHFFLKHRANDLAEVITRVHPAVAAGRTDALPTREADGPWWFHGTAGPPDDDPGPDRTGTAASRGREPQPGMGRFLLVAFSQLVSITGSALTEFALPIWIYLQTGSMGRFALYAVIGMLPGILIGPLAGAIVDRMDRRRVMLLGDLTAGGTQGVLLLLLVSGSLHPWHIYVLLGALSVALTFQRLAYASAVPQLVPKQYLGHANGIVQLAGGVAQFVVPLIAVGLMAGIGLRGILILDVISYTIAITIIAFVKFPRTLPWRRRESLTAEIKHGFTYSWRHRGFRAMLLWFAVLNLFLSPLFLLTTPLVLSFDSLGGAARVSMAAGAGVIVGGIAMGFWGGPRRQRLRGMLWLAAALAGASAFTGLHASLWVVGIGAFGMSCALSLVNGVYTTIVQVKVPQRFHGRVFALNTLVAWSTLPIGHGIIAPLGAKLFEPLMTDDGPLASSMGRLIGHGEGRGIGLLYLVFGAAMLALVLIGLRLPVLAHFDRDVPDAPADDEVGIQERERRIRARAAGSAPALAEVSR
ncbi:amino acid adenylation domain-containing protein [Embleya sp. NPDC059237]|uniref:non-ribosomal peptide synthetase/MFS transporter n=1 Tax=Embleya sp. NPDC059237 TaxID=3346784 RepID=UPI0036A7C93F